MAMSVTFITPTSSASTNTVTPSARTNRRRFRGLPEFVASSFSVTSLRRASPLPASDTIPHLSSPATAGIWVLLIQPGIQIRLDQLMSPSGCDTRGPGADDAPEPQALNNTVTTTAQPAMMRFSTLISAPFQSSLHAVGVATRSATGPGRNLIYDLRCKQLLPGRHRRGSRVCPSIRDICVVADRCHSPSLPLTAARPSHAPRLGLPRSRHSGESINHFPHPTVAVHPLGMAAPTKLCTLSRTGGGREDHVVHRVPGQLRSGVLGEVVNNR